MGNKTEEGLGFSGKGSSRQNSAHLHLKKSSKR